MANRWRDTLVGKITQPSSERVGHGNRPPVLSSTKHFGLVRSEEYFRGRQIFSQDISLYKTATRGQIVYATNHLAEGSIGLQRDFPVAAVSPMYTVFGCTDDVVPEYLIRVLKSPPMLKAYKVQEQASVDRRGAVRYSHLASLPISIPEVPEQSQIVADLTALDQAVLLTEKEVAKHRLVREGVCDELFTRGIDGRGELRADSELDAESPAGPAPRDWDFSPAGKLFSIQLGKMLDTKRFGNSPRFAYLTNRNVQWRKIDLGELEQMPFSALERKKFALANGDVIMCEGGEVGRCAVWRHGSRSVYYQKALHRLRARALIDPDYFVAYMAWIVRRNGLASWVGRTSIAHFPLAKLSAFPVRVPSPEEQERIVTVLAALGSMHDSSAALLEKLKCMRRGLSDDLLTGRVRVPLKDTE